MRTSKLQLTPLILCLLFSFSLTAADVNFRTLSISEAITEAEIQDKHLFISYEADWCLPCQIMEENVLKNDAVVSKLNDDFVSVKVNFDNQSHKEWFGKYEVSSLPTLTIVDDTGIELIRQEGTMNLATFLAFLDSNTKQPKTVERSNRVIRAQYASPPNTSLTTIQFGAFSKLENAEHQQRSVENLLSISTTIIKDESGLYKLLYMESITREERKVIIANAYYKKLDFFVK